MSRSSALFAASTLLSFAALAAPGDLDPSFGTGGKATYDFPGRQVQSTRGIAMAQHGKIVVLVRLRETEVAAAPIQGEMGLAKFRHDGSLDPAFGQQGRTASSLHHDPAATVGASGHLEPWTLAVQPDGKILVGGFGTALREGSPIAGPVVMRFKADGTLDTAFGSGGRVAVAPSEITSSTYVGVNAIAVGEGGRVVVAGRVAASNSFGGFIAAFHADGSPDAAFGSAGVVWRPGIPNSRQSLALQAGGRILVGGMESNRLSARRLLPNGAPDPDFIGGGWVEFFSDRPLIQTGVHALSNGRVVMTGFKDFSGAHGTGPARAAIAVYDLGTPGAGTLRVFDGITGAILDSHRDSQDRIVSTGQYYPNLGAATFAARFTPAGEADTSFGAGDGLASFIEPSSGGEGALQPDGKTLLSGLGSGPVVIRVLGDPLDPAADLDADGIPNGVEEFLGLQPSIKDNDLFSDPRLFAMQQYRDFLGREGDNGGVNYWTSQLSSGTQTRAQMVESFFGSAEFQGLAAPVARLYFAYFLRIPDYGGLNHWIGQYRSGSSLEALSNAFATSPEFVNTYGTLDNAGFVDRVYRNVLGRAPDSGGLAHWKGQLDNSGMTRGQLMLAFSESAEYRALIANEVYVTMLYAGMLRRVPDPGGFSYWVSYLDGGNSGLALIEGFLAAPEYRGRFLP